MIKKLPIPDRWGWIALLFFTCGFPLVMNAQLPGSKKMSLTAEAPASPVIRGIEQNPFLKLRIEIDKNAGDLDLTQLVLGLSRNSVASIEELSVFLTGAEPFHDRQKLFTVRSLNSRQEIPLEGKLKPGVHFLWVSVRLKADIAPGVPLEIHALSLSSKQKGISAIVEKGNYFRKLTAVALRKAGDDGVHTYRIPGITRTRKGTLIIVYDIRYRNATDLPGDIDVGMSRSTDNGRTWQPMKIIMDMGEPHAENGVGDPAVLYDPVSDKIWVAALWSKGNRSIAGSKPGLSPDTTGQFVLCSSNDDGLTWTKPYTITPQVKDPAWHLFFAGPGNGICMKNGTLVFPAQYWDENRVPHSTLIYSEDRGTSWKGGIKGPKSNTTESQLVETRDGTLMLNMRDNRGRYRSVAVTQDMGKSWTEHATSYSAFPDPVCMAGLTKANVKVNNALKEILFFSNPATFSGRFNLTLKASRDGGESWRKEDAYLVDERTGFGYSAIIGMDSHSIGLVYEGVRDLYFIVIPVSEILK